MTVIATVRRATLYCELRNLSRSGCMIACRRILADAGSPIIIEIAPDLTVSGEVIWQVGESVGVLFSEAIPSTAVRRYALDDWMLKAGWKEVGDGLRP